VIVSISKEAATDFKQTRLYKTLIEQNRRTIFLEVKFDNYEMCTIDELGEIFDREIDAKIIEE